jgi:hypothetical protein
VADLLDDARLVGVCLCGALGSLALREGERLHLHLPHTEAAAE